MSWTTPRTWVDGEFVDASLMNAHVREQLEHMVASPLPTNVAYSGGAFTNGTPGGTWTVDSGDLTTFWYYRNANRWRASIRVSTSSIGGTASSQLRISMASFLGGATIYRNSSAPMRRLFDNGTLRPGMVFCRAGTNYIECYRRDIGLWTASTNNTTFTFTVQFVTNVNF